MKVTRLILPGQDGDWGARRQGYFLADLSKTLSNLLDFGHHVVLGTNANDDEGDGDMSVIFAEIVIKEAVIKEHRGDSVPASCDRNT